MALTGSSASLARSSSIAESSSSAAIRATPSPRSSSGSSLYATAAILSRFPAGPPRRRGLRRLERGARDEHRRLVAGDVLGQALGEPIGEAADDLGLDVERVSERDEVRPLQVDPVRRIARAPLVVAQHPVAAVVDDDERKRQLLLGDGGELADAEQDPSVT